MLNETNVILAAAGMTVLIVVFVIVVFMHYDEELLKVPHYRPFNIDLAMAVFVAAFLACAGAVVNEWIRVQAINPNSDAADASRAFSTMGIALAAGGVGTALIAFVVYRLVFKSTAGSEGGALAE